MQDTSFKLDHYPVAFMPGSLPFGDVVDNTPIHAVRGLSNVFDKDYIVPDNAFQPIDLPSQLAFVIDDVATPDEALSLIKVSETLGFRSEAPGIRTPPGMRQNKSVHWLADEAILGPIFRRIEPFLPAELEGQPLHKQLSHRINMYRYDENDVFNPHIDGDWPGYGLDETQSAMLEWSGCRSMLTMLLYLNGHEDGIQGGETHLFSHGAINASVKPKTGRALFFRHGSTKGSVLHEGAKVLGSTSKYVARINVMYKI